MALSFSIFRRSNKLSQDETFLLYIACKKQLEEDFCPSFNLLPVKVVLEPSRPANGSIPCLLRDSTPADPSDAFAYHENSETGPKIHVLVNNLQSLPGRLVDSASCALGHEMMETIADSYNTSFSDRGDGTFEAYEVCDRVQGLSYEKVFNGSTVKVTNFLLPTAFSNTTKKRKYDFMGVLKNPREITPGGYAIIRDIQGNTEIEGSETNARAFSRRALLRYSVRPKINKSFSAALDGLCPACISLGRESTLESQKAKHVCPHCHHVEPCCQP